MASDFHNKPFDEGTLTKLELFERYAEEWLPVFVARQSLIWHRVNIFDFFAGPGVDSLGVEGSPLRLLRVVAGQKQHVARHGLKVGLYFSDDHAGKIRQLQQEVAARGLDKMPVDLNIKHADFVTRFSEVKPLLESKDSANLIIIDQCGVKEVPDGMFEQIVQCGTTDVLFFISSTTFRRFPNVPEIKRLTLKGYQRPSDYYKAHLAVAKAYRALIPAGRKYYIASFSIKKGANVYGVIFGSRHPLGMDKFLEVAWNENKVTGDANFDVHREGIRPEAPGLFDDMNVPSKVRLFEETLESAILSGACRDEVGIINLCHSHGVLRRHATSVLAKLKTNKRVRCDFRVPDIKRLKEPRLIKFL